MPIKGQIMKLRVSDCPWDSLTEVISPIITTRPAPLKDQSQVLKGQVKWGSGEPSITMLTHENKSSKHSSRAAAWW